MWKDEVIRERFAWNEESCLHVALVRVFRLPSVWSFPYQPGYGGCRSWVKLPDEGQALMDTLTPSMNEAAWNEVALKVRSLLADG